MATDSLFSDVACSLGYRRWCSLRDEVRALTRRMSCCTKGQVSYTPLSEPLVD